LKEGNKQVRLFFDPIISIQETILDLLKVPKKTLRDKPPEKCRENAISTCGM